MMVMCDTSDVMEYNRRRPEMSNEKLNVAQVTTSIEY